MGNEQAVARDPLSYIMQVVLSMPRKNTNENESLAILFIHSTVIVQVLLQVRERTLQFVIRVRHSLAAFFLTSEQVWHIKV